MTDRRQQENSKKSLVAEPSPPAEQKELEAICASVLIEEISFDVWCQHHNKLDLHYPITIARTLLKQTYKTVIRLSRSIRKTTGQGRIETREKFEYELLVKPCTDKQKIMVVRGLGDRVDDAVGDLCIVIKIQD